MPAAPRGWDCPTFPPAAPSRDTIAVDGGTVRKKSAGLLSLVVAAGLGTTLGMPGRVGHPSPHREERRQPGADKPDDASGHELPQPAGGQAPRAARGGHHRLLNGTGKVEKRGASTVMKVASTASPSSVNANGRARPPSADDAGPVRRAEPREDRQDLRGARGLRQRASTRASPTRTSSPSTPGPTTFDGPQNNKIPAPDRSEDNSTNWQPNYDQQYFQNLYFGQGDAAGSGETPGVGASSTSSGSPRAATASTARSPTGSRCATTRPATAARATTRRPTATTRTSAPATSAPTPGTWSGTAVNQWVADQKAAGRSRGRDHRRAEVLRPVGPLRRRRRRQLQRARRLHRPLPDRARRRRRGRR